MIKKTLKKIKLKILNSIQINYKYSSNRLCWCKEKNGNLNFGDQIGPYLFKKITKKEIIYSTPQNVTKYTTYVTVGSIMNVVKKNSIIWGTGIMHKNDIFYKPFKVLAVRGPLTRKRFIELGYECPEVYGDPGLLLPFFYQKSISKKYKLGIAPHFVDLNLFIKFSMKDILIIDVRRQVEKVIDDICKCEFILSSSLHGCIVSHAYNIPCVWIKLSNNILGDDTKFYDYFYSLNITNIKPIDLRYRKISELNFFNFIPFSILPYSLGKIQSKLFKTIEYIILLMVILILQI